MNVCSSIHDGQQTGKKNRKYYHAVNQEEKNAVSPHNGIVFSHKKGMGYQYLVHMDEPQKTQKTPYCVIPCI